MGSAAAEMPRYQCHKRVHAFKIAALKPDGDFTAMQPADTGYGPIVLDAAFMLKHQPRIGGYYVVYDDGYKSFSPADAFESGYSKI